MYKRIFIVSCLLLFRVSFLAAQGTYSVYGRVFDSKTREPLAFVNIVINQSNYGGTTDIDGKFRFSYSQPIKTLKFSYVGYDPLIYSVGARTQNLVITMERKEIELKEVEILPGINPAHRIIRNAIDNRDLNDPEKLKSFSYTMYEKTLFTIDADTSVKEGFSDSTRKPGLVGVSVDFRETKDSIREDSAAMDSL
ncbi:MAG: carboxypeptidase-like regulatory domain-containing protein, partial [bacterium]